MQSVFTFLAFVIQMIDFTVSENLVKLCWVFLRELIPSSMLMYVDAMFLLTICN